MDEEDLEGLSPGSILSEALTGGGSYGTEESHRFASDYLTNFMSEETDDEDPEQEILDRMRQKSAAHVKALQTARARLQAQRYNPGELLLAASEALGRPTRTGTIGETIGNTFGALRDPLSRRGEFERGREAELLDMDTAEASAYDDVDQAELALGMLDRRLRAEMAGRALTAISKPLRPAGGTGSLAKQREIAHNYSLLLRAGQDPDAAWDRAVKLAFDNIRLVFDPALGTLREVDMIMGQGREIPVTPNDFGGGADPRSGQPGPAASPADASNPGAPGPLGDAADPGAPLGPEPMTIWGAAESGTGWWSGLSQALNIAKGNLGMDINEDVADARSTLYKSTQPMVRALTLNDQFPVREIERLREEMDTLPSMSSNPAMLRRSLVQLRRYMDDALVKAEADWRNVNNPSNLRQARGAIADAIRDFIPVLGVPRSEMLEYQDSLFVEPEELPGFDQLNPAEQQELRELRERVLE